MRSIRRPHDLNLRDLYKRCKDLNLDVYVNKDWINFYLFSSKKEPPPEELNSFIDELEEKYEL